ncbi:SUMF1/EgtB/PvdO family nonheme iron enzyme [Leptospira idonii]|uniref:Formylglycine-generating enzyme family protein n=1 Tax=Leptospira idonii TaxID=1193500 RepID=A0A4R9M088_9LEPT|nr:SUMF1/EgtB/PvdO family nonheme iron enzyme [Leptospira idonii]TGN18045.1 formylglycine-generating enzyme family protein [Leptospira idonii]
MVWVPTGSFENTNPLYPEEISRSSETVRGFWMDRTETTNDAFSEFVRETGYITEAETINTLSGNIKSTDIIYEPGAVVFLQPDQEKSYGHPLEWWHFVSGANWRHPEGPGSSIEGKGSYPVVAVTYKDALAYALWKGHTLPSESEWEWASTGGTKLSDSDSPPQEANTWQGDFPLQDEGKDGFKGISPVGCYAKNGFGLYDMIGNVWEHTSDVWELSKKNEAKERVIKGGSYLCSPNYCKRYRSGARQPQEEHLAANHIGFRTILRENKDLIKNKIHR